MSQQSLLNKVNSEKDSNVIELAQEVIESFKQILNENNQRDLNINKYKKHQEIIDLFNCYLPKLKSQITKEFCQTLDFKVLSIRMKLFQQCPSFSGNLEKEILEDIELLEKKLIKNEKNNNYYFKIE